MSGFNWDSEIPTEEELSQREKEVEKQLSVQAQAQEESEPMEENYEVLDEIVEEEFDESEFLTSARLRLEQGRLYEMFLKHNLFGEIDSDPRAVANVQKELKGFIQERLEVLLGLKPDPKLQKIQVAQSLPFNPLEIDILKKVISRISGGATEQPEARQVPVAAPRADSLKPLSSPRTAAAIQPIKEVSRKPLQRTTQPPKASPVRKPAPEQASARPDKPLSEYTKAEKEARALAVANEQRSKKAPPTRRTAPMPSFDQQVLHYGSQSNTFAGSGLVGRIIQNLPKGE